MAESFITTNRFFDNKHYPRGFSRHGHFTIKEAQLLERHGFAFNELDMGKRAPRRTKKNSLFLYAVVSVCRKQQKKKCGLSIWSVFANQNASTRCPVVNLRSIRRKTIPTQMINIIRNNKLKGAFVPLSFLRDRLLQFMD